MSVNTLSWSGELVQPAVDLLAEEGGMVVSPTKVGYIIMVTDKQGLERKFSAKDRKRNKPGVVLCGSLEQLFEIAEVNDEVAELYRRHWDDDILLGCILPWKAEGRKYIPDDGSSELMTDSRGTSCFVVKFGTPGEQIADELWKKHSKLSFASSANPSGKGNNGRVELIGDQIAQEADLVIAGNDYVRSIQPDADDESRHQQGVMVSMVDADGALVPLQQGERAVSPAPTLIRKGLDYEKIMAHLSEVFLSWDYRQGMYY